MAELTVGAMVALLRRVLECDDAVRTGGTREGLIGCTLKGKTVGLVGTGAIGLRVAELLQPFGCELIAYAPHERPARWNWASATCRLRKWSKPPTSSPCTPL